MNNLRNKKNKEKNSAFPISTEELIGNDIQKAGFVKSEAKRLKSGKEVMVYFNNATNKIFLAPVMIYSKSMAKKLLEQFVNLAKIVDVDKQAKEDNANIKNAPTVPVCEKDKDIEK